MSATKAIAKRRDELLARFPGWRERTLDAWLDDCADRYAARPFVLSDDDCLTYEQVAVESRRLAAGLIALGVRPGDRVGLVMANYPEFVTVKFAIARVGAIAVPFNYLYRRDELAFVLGDSGCRVLVTMTGFADLDYQSMLDDIVPGWDRAGFASRSDSSDSLATLRHVVVFETDRPRRKGVRSVVDLGELAADTADRVVSQSDPRAPGDILYTLGHDGVAQGRGHLTRRCAAHGIRLCTDARIRGWPAGPVLVAVLSHVRLRRGSAFGDVRGWCRGFAAEVHCRRLFPRDSTAPRHRHPLCADDGSGDGGESGSVGL